MKRYEKYKDSGISWIGEIPEHWKVKSLRNFLSLVSIKGHGDKQLLSVTRENGVIVRDIESKEENHNFIPDDLSGYKLVKEGQFVINKMKSWQGSYGVSKYTGIVSPAYYVCDLRFHNKDFFSLAIRSKAYVPFFTQYSKGIRVDQWDLSTNALKSIPFVVPNAEEQKEIVDYIIQKSADIDRYIEIKQKEINALDELKQSIIAETVTKGLDKNVAMKDSDIAWIGKVPEHWKIKRSAMLFQENKKKNSTLEYERAMKFNYGTLVDKNETGELKELEDTYKNYTILDKNDIVINCLNLNYDFVSQRVAISPKRSIITSAYLVLRPRKNTNAHYYNYLLKAMDSMKLFHGMGTGIRLTLSFDEFKKQLLPIPPLSEQEVIVAYINSKCEKIDKMKSSIESQITALKEYKQRLISDVVTGKRKVTSEN